MLLHPVKDGLVNIRLPLLSEQLDGHKIKDANGSVPLNKTDLFQRAQKYDLKPFLSLTGIHILSE